MEIDSLPCSLTRQIGDNGETAHARDLSPFRGLIFHPCPARA
jgi:hypothetical protein